MTNYTPTSTLRSSQQIEMKQAMLGWLDEVVEKRGASMFEDSAA